MLTRRFVLVSAAAVTILVVIAGRPLAGQGRVSEGAATKDWSPPLTLWGDPDLQGVWTSNTVNFVPIERPAEFGERPYLTDEDLAEALRGVEEQKVDANSGVGSNPLHWYEWWADPLQSRQTSLVVDPPNGRVPPLTAEAIQRIENREQGRVKRGLAPNAGSSPDPRWASWEDADLWDRCITRGLPNAYISTSYNNAYRILQVPGYVVILHEMLERRIIPLDGGPQLDKTIDQWLGSSRGRWEGSTLVVDVTNFSEKTNGTLKSWGGHRQFVGSGDQAQQFRGSGTSLHLIERFRRVDDNTLEYEVTVDDPTTWTKPWKLRIPLGLVNNYQIFEYACHEANYAMRHILLGSRAADEAGPVKD